MLQLALVAFLVATPAAADTPSPAAKPEASTAAHAHPTPAAAPKAAAKSVEPAEKLICRREDSTGNRTSRAKLCMTKKQWKEFNRSN